MEAEKQGNMEQGRKATGYLGYGNMEAVKQGKEAGTQGSTEASEG